MFSTGTNLASKTRKKSKKVSVSYLASILLVKKELKKIQMNLVYRVQNFFLLVDSVAGTKYGRFRYYLKIKVNYMVEKRCVWWSF